MAFSSDYLSKILKHSHRLFYDDQELSPPGELQYYGRHFLAAIQYAVKSTSNRSDATFRNGLSTFEELARDLWSHPSKSARKKLLNAMASFLPEFRVVFAVQKLHRCLGDKAPNDNKVDVMAGFIEFLVDALEKSSSPSCSWIIIPTEINRLCNKLTFLLAILGDTPFQCPDLEEIENILVAILPIADQVGIFLCTFFFTTDRVTMSEVELELSALLSKLDVAEENIKEQCAKVVQKPKITTPDLTSTSMYLVDSLLDDLNHLLHHNTNLFVEVKDEVTTLYEKLYSCRSMLRDIELLQDKELKECEMQLIDLAYQVEYLIACFVAEEIPVWYLAFRLHSLIEKSNPIEDSLTKFPLKSRLRGLPVAERSSVVSSSQVDAKSNLAVDEIIVGFKETRKQIVEQLCGGPKNLQIISIIGMGGLGKTTLAKRLYNDSNIIRHFDRRSWCVVSQTYQKAKLLIDILSSTSTLGEDELLKMEDHELADCVYKSLKGNRYLLIVDDIWKKEAWDYDLKRYFPDDKNGSRVLFTSRNKDVALETSLEPIIHELPLLSVDESWDLLQKKVFPNSICPPEFEDVGKKIARDCNGLPLAVVGIAAILANIKNESLWQEVATSLSSYLSKRVDILELSYTHLPSHLKPCFLYLGVFKEDEEIPARKLFSLWVSNGFIPKNEHKDLEDTAEDYLMELINRSMVQVTVRRSDNGVKTCTMHDLIRDMCVRLAEKEKFLTIINDGFSTFGQHHHICFRFGSSDFRSRLIGRHFRSFLDESTPFFSATSSMKRLRVLKFPKSFNERTLKSLGQLRYLESHGCFSNSVKSHRSLSNSVSHMNLEVLRMGQELSTGDIQLNMPKLRHLHLYRGATNFYSRFPLKYLHMSQTNSLQTLCGVVITNLEDEERLRCFSHLRRIKCTYIKNWVEHRSANLIFLTELVSLNIRGSSLSTKPKAINFPIHIKKLSISSMDLNCELLSSIGTLPHLEILKLHKLHIGEPEGGWNTNDGELQKLKFLKLEEVYMGEWNTLEDHFPVLEHLVLKRCHTPKPLPSELGYIPTLQKIEVNHCNKNLRNSAMDLIKKQDEAGNELLKIIVSGTWLDW